MVEGLYKKSALYPDNRRQACYPPPMHTIEDLISEVSKILDVSAFFSVQLHFCNAIFFCYLMHLLFLSFAL